MRDKATAALADLPLRNLKAPLDAGETRRQKVTRPTGSMVEAAMNRAGLEPKQLADEMGVSPSFLLRGFKDQEHISWQRIHRVTDRRFRQALLAVQAEELTGVVVRTVIEIATSAKVSA